MADLIFELANVIEELPLKCECGNEKYKSLCYTCYKRGKLNGKKRN